MALCQNQSFSSQASNEDHPQIVRQTANFPVTVWGDYFIGLSHSPSKFKPKVNKMEGLKEEVKAMLKNSNDLGRTLRLIDDLQRLGLSYHFEEEINEILRRIQNMKQSDEHDICVVALHFRLLRQQGYNVSADVFAKFIDEGGKFKQELSKDAKGLLYLYEASWLGKPQEAILDKAMAFAKGHMESQLMANIVGNSVVSAQLKRALEMPFHRGMRRLEARHYIDNYDLGDKASNRGVLELAKLDFNLLQSLHQSEIKVISMWWKEMELVEKLNFARDRLVECYFWILGVHFEPRYSQGRLLLTKLIALASVMDDMFDAYGTIEELQLFNHVIQRWDFQEVDHLPEYMTVYLNSFMSIITDIEKMLIIKGMLHHKHYLIESIKDLVGAYFEEAKWASRGYTPTLEEYLHISVTSSGYPMLTCASLILMGEQVTKVVFDWVLKVPKIVEASALIARLMDDLVSTKLEQERNHVASSVQCYMNDHGVTEQEACAKLNKMVANAWKDMNKECLYTSRPSQKHLNMLALNFARMIEVIYKHEDGYTNPSGEMKENISLLLVHPIED